MGSWSRALPWCVRSCPSGERSTGMKNLFGNFPATGLRWRSTLKIFSGQKMSTIINIWVIFQRLRDTFAGERGRKVWDGKKAIYENVIYVLAYHKLVPLFLWYSSLGWFWWRDGKKLFVDISFFSSLKN